MATGMAISSGQGVAITKHGQEANRFAADEPTRSTAMPTATGV